MRPSQALQIEHTWLAYCIDEAVGAYGRWVESTLQETYTDGPNKGKSKYRIEDLLGMPIQTRKISMADVMSMPLG